ncbi:hypothetical protein L227DRAFT_155798 [Lentinus tigrinus ALCF2SS1-6]|uniref:DUF6533 domain-containing protein n=1 Tax=Lentinus tigrinus ALCF2SS1-6 TaxID=1328759 RepID=A0A5C2S9E9_9APHY|nr:hypothetical protein L227DRAFT_155798 [Lentinus tigrinus ALCF2SS1-6]
MRGLQTHAMNDEIPTWIDIAEDPASVQAMLTNTAVGVSMSTLFFYDYLVMLPTEIRTIWSPPTNLASVAYLWIRYGFLAQYLLSMVHNMHFTQGGGPNLTAQSCRELLGFLTILNMLNFAVISAFIATRLFAMWERNWFIGILTFVLGVVSPSSITMLTTFAFGVIPAPWPFPPCLSYVPDFSPIVALSTRNLPLAVSAISIAYESFCLGLTAAKTFRLYMVQRETGIPTTLTSLLLRDGCLYFSVLLILAISNIVSCSIHNPLFDAWQVNTDVARTLIPILTTLRGLCGSGGSVLARARTSSVETDDNRTSLRFARGYKTWTPPR